MTAFRVGIDTGGTFTDLIALDESTGEIHLGKVFSTPGQPAEALLNALAQAQIPLPAVKQLIHGTTVATNALLEHKGAKVAYVTTAGFEDIPFIQRIRREYHYDLMWVKPAPLVERYHCFGATERVDYRGEVVIPLDLASLQPVIDGAKRGEIEAIAVCYLYAPNTSCARLTTCRRRGCNAPCRSLHNSPRSGVNMNGPARRLPMLTCAP